MYGLMRRSILAAMLMCLAGTALAGVKSVTVSQEEKEAIAKNNGVTDTWGLAVGVGVEVYSNEYVKQAETFGDERIVRVTDSYTSRPNIWAVGTWTPPIVDRWKNIRPGLYFGVNLLANDQVVDGMSVGVQLTFMERVKVGTPSDTEENKMDGFRPNWVLGIGLVNHSTQSLLSGINKNQPLPDEYNDIRYKRGRENSFVIMLTKSIGK